MSWDTYSWRFRQLFPNGLRYLDHCGEFMLAMMEKCEALPTDIKPSGAKLTIPEHGIQASVDSTGLEVFQETPSNDTVFIEFCIVLSDLAERFFGPLTVELNLLEMKLMHGFPQLEQAEEACLKLVGEHNSLKGALDMIPRTQRLDATFASGSNQFQVVLQPVVFETVTLQRHHSIMGATKSQKNRATRLNAKAERLQDLLPYAVFLELTNSEQEPPLNSLGPLYDVLLKKADIVKELFPIK